MSAHRYIDFLSNFCQTPGKVFRLGVDFVLPLSQEQEQEEQQQPPTKTYQWAVF